MGVPKRRSSKMRTRIRKTANASKLGKLFVDPKTGTVIPVIRLILSRALIVAVKF